MKPCATPNSPSEVGAGLLDTAALYRTMLNALAESVLVCSPQGRVLACNPAAERLLGLSLTQIQERSLSDWQLLREDGTPCPPEELPLAQTLATGEARHGVTIGYVSPSGEVVWSLANSAPVFCPAGGGLSAVVLSITDISQRKKAEDEQQRLNRTLRAFSASSCALLHAEDETAYMQEVCRIVVEQCGHAMTWIGFAEDDPEKSVRPVVHAGFEDGYLDTLRLTWADSERGRGPSGTALRTGKVAICHHMLNDPCFLPWRDEALRRGYAASICLPLLEGGRAFGILTIYSRLPDPFTEEEIRVLGELAEDLAYGITMLRIRAAHARQEAALRASEERYRLLVEQWVDGVFVADAQGRYLDVNLTGAAMLGYTPEEICRLTIPDILMPEEEARLPAEVARFAGGAVVGSEWKFRRKDGTSFLGEILGRQLPNGHLQAVVRDITQRREAEEALRQARLAALNLAQDAVEVRRESEEANARLKREVAERKAMMGELERARAAADAASQLKSEFLANMSHEIRTPLNAVLGLAQVGERDNVGRQSQETFKRILQSGQLLLSLINDILDFSKMEAGKMSLEQEPFGLGEVIDRAVNVNAAPAFAKGLDFEVRESADLPSSLVGDSLRLSQIIINLLSNAIKFTSQGHVRLGAHHEGGELVLRIQDTGIGMTPEQASRLFTPFEQADGSTTRRFGGTGLGLAISKRLVDMMGGTIRVDSQAGQGSEFELRLPLAVAEAPIRAKAGTRIALAGLPQEECTRLRQELLELGAEVSCLDTSKDYVPARDELLLVPESELLDARQQLELSSRAKAGQAIAVAHRPGSSASSSVILPLGVTRMDYPLRARHLLAAVAQPLAREQVSERGPRLAGYRILAAEDNEVNRLVLAQMLEGEGARLDCVENGRLAVERVRREGASAWDIVLMDIQMPELDGHEATRQIRVFAPDLPIVGLTAHALAEERERCLASGMVAHISKPVDLGELAAVIRREARRPGQTGAQSPPLALEKEAPARLEAGSASSGLVDWPALAQQFSTKPDFVLKLAALALNSQRDMPEKLRLAASVPEDLSFLAHGLKGVLGNLKARDLMQEAVLCDQAAQARSPEAPALAEHLAQGLEALLAELAAYVKARG